MTYSTTFGKERVGPDASTLRILASPQDTALDGRSVAPGRILEWIDKVGYACAVGWAGGYCVTAYVGNVRFTRPVAPGQLVQLTAQIIHTGRTSMQVLVTVASADLTDGVYRPALDCLLVFVALDESRRPRVIPQWTPHDERERLLNEGARDRLEARRAIRDAMLAQNYSDRGTTPRSRLRFLSTPSDANWGGNAHGGTVMKWIDEAAFTVAARWSSTSASAVYSGGIHFLRPIRIGHVVELDARLLHVDEEGGMHIATRVSSAPAESPDHLELTTVCTSIFKDGAHRNGGSQLRALELRSDEDRRLDGHARALIDMRRKLSNLPL